MGEKVVNSKKLDYFVYTCILIGILSFLIGLSLDGDRVWRSYLISNLFFIGIGVGSVAFLAFHYLANSTWFVLIRRIPEAMASQLKILAPCFLLLFFALDSVYPWADPATRDTVLHHHHGKEVYFGTIFWMLRVALVLFMLWFFSCKMVRNSLLEDEKGGLEFRGKQKVLSAIFFVLFAPLFSMFAFDTIMSLEPTWFSTIFGVYTFVGFIQNTIAFSIISVFFLKKFSYLKLVREDHIHDLAKFLFGWSIFWGYIALSQYLLIWYANLPEETFYYIDRTKDASWNFVTVLVPVLKFVLPFLLLLPRKAKRNLKYVTAVACIVVVSEFINLSWMILPSLIPSYALAWQDIGLFIGFFGIFLHGVLRFYRKNSLLPSNDPYLEESKDHHVVYA